MKMQYSSRFAATRVMQVHYVPSLHVDSVVPDVHSVANSQTYLLFHITLWQSMEKNTWGHDSKLARTPVISHSLHFQQKGYVVVVALIIQKYCYSLFASLNNSTLDLVSTERRFHCY